MFGWFKKKQKTTDIMEQVYRDQYDMLTLNHSCKAPHGLHRDLCDSASVIRFLPDPHSPFQSPPTTTVLSTVGLCFSRSTILIAKSMCRHSGASRCLQGYPNRDPALPY